MYFVVAIEFSLLSYVQGSTIKNNIRNIKR